MSDGTISAPPSQVPPNNAAPSNATHTTTATVDTLPPDIPINKLINGEVIANDKTRVTIRTDNGNVVLDAAMDILVGQKVSLRLQQVTQQSVPVTLADIITDKARPALPPVAAPAIDPVLQDPVIVHDPAPFKEYKPLQALITQMPDILNDETVDRLLKTMLNLPPNKPLPPGLQEGLQKLTQLNALLSQANLLSGQDIKAQPMTAAGIQQNILSVVQQLFQNLTPKTVLNNPLLNQTPQSFIQLQAIQPGQTLSPNILVEMKQQLMTVLQQNGTSIPLQPSASVPSSTGLMGLLPKPMVGLMGKAAGLFQGQSPSSPVIGGAQENAGIGAKTIFTAPMVGLVLASPTQAVPQIQNPVLVFMQMPGTVDGGMGKQFIGFLSPTVQQGDASGNLLPGSVIVTAMQPQGQKSVQFTTLPAQLLPELVETFLPLNPSLGETWPVLDEIWDQAMAQQSTNPEILASLRQVIPSPSAQTMPPTMLFFLSVLKNGLSAEWVPEKHLAMLEGIDKNALIETLSRDLSAIRARLEDQQPVDAWRPLPIPMQLGDQLMRLQWFYRHPQDDYQAPEQQEEGIQKKRKTRFLLNVPKTGLGDIQIDGLIQERKLDLILRTEDTLMSHMETAIRGRYNAALEVTGMVGGIDFQSGRHHYVHV